MPRIRPYEQEVSAQGTIPSQRASGSDFGGPGLQNLGHAIASVGQSAAQAYHIEQQREQHALERVEAQKRQASTLALHQRVVETQSEWALAEQERQKQAPPDAAGHLEEAHATIKANIDEEIERVLNDPHGTILHEDIPRFRLELTRTGNHIISSASTFAAATGARHQIGQLTDTVGAIQNAVRSDPSLLGVNLERIDDLVGGLTMANRGDLPAIRDKSRQSIVDAALDGKIDDLARTLTPASVAALRGQVEDGNNIWIKEASPAGYARALDRLNVLDQHVKNVSTVLAADTLKERLREASAGVDNKLDVKEAAYEQDPARRALLERSILEAKAVGEATRVMRGASYEDQTNLLTAGQRLLEKSGNFDLDKARLDAMKTVFANQYQAIQHDPAGVAVRNEAVKVAYEGIQPDDPSTVEQYVTATKAEQRRIAPYQEPVLLTKDQVGQIKATLDGIDRGPQGANHAEKIIGDQYRLWGKHWPEVSRQLMQEKVLTDAQAAAARMIMDPLKHADMRVLLSTSMMKPEDMPLPPGTARRVEEEVQSQLLRFYTAVATQRNGPQEMVRQTQAVKTLALGYMLRDRTLTDTKAAEMAADAVLMKDFHWMGTYFVPKAYEPSTIERGVKAAMRDLPTLASSVLFPESRSELRKEDHAAAVVDTLVSGTRWATNADNSGVVLQWGDRDHNPVMIQHHPFHIDWSANPDTFGKREDGTSKGFGYFGALKRFDRPTEVSTELSTSDPVERGGKPILHPLIVPTLTADELQYLLKDQPKNEKMEASIYGKSAEWARQRIAVGKSPFAESGEQYNLPGSHIPLSYTWEELQRMGVK